MRPGGNGNGNNSSAGMKSLPVGLHVLSVNSVVQPEVGPIRAETHSFSLGFNVQVLCLTSMYCCHGTRNIMFDLHVLLSWYT